ncbi:MAG: ATP-binding protein, partial [Parcubacteria group bacterium]
FEKFFRSDNAIKYQTEGTGLGLYISKNIIEQLGGRIWFQSIENVGSKFNFSLPIAPVDKE